MGEWRKLTIEDVADVFDGPHATPEKTEDGPWFLSISSLVSGRLILSESAHLSETDYVKWTKRVTPREGDLLFSYETRLGEAALMPPGIKACLGRRMGLLRPKLDVVDPRFLLYVYLGPVFQQTIAERAVHGATVDRIPLAEFSRWPISVPGISEQRAIAEVLGALDDKIALNERMRETALHLGRSLLEREVRESGVVVRVGDVSDLVYGKALPLPARREGNIPVFGCTGQVGWHDVPLTNSATPVVGRKGVNAGHVSWMPQPGWVIDTAFFARPRREGLTSEALYFLLEAANIGSLIADSAVPGVNRNAALEHKMLMPDATGMERFTRQARSLLALREQQASEIRTLAELRDTLLPQLLSGKLRVKDAVRTVEEVV